MRKISHMRFDSSSWSCLAYVWTRIYHPANYLELSTNRSRVSDPTFGPPCERLIFKIYGHAEHIIKSFFAWAGLTFSRCYDRRLCEGSLEAWAIFQQPVLGTIAAGRSSITFSSYALALNTRERSCTYSGHSTYLMRLTHCRKWKKFAAASRGATRLASIVPMLFLLERTETILT